MLENKDYCDYETCVALKELGYKVPTSAYYMPHHKDLIWVSNPFRGGYVTDCFRSHNSFPKDVMTSNYIDAPTMWEAQKWLREAKEIEVVVLSKGMVGSPYYYQVYTEDYVVDYNEEYNSYEEALIEGIKASVKILKEK
jgi:hypothetical protein